jgi:hypothetical protein
MTDNECLGALILILSTVIFYAGVLFIGYLKKR